jgi:predicted phage terminase large subunit-like protein
MGAKTYAAQFLQTPIPDGGAVFDWKWFKFFDAKNPPKFDFIFQSWDTASSISETADYSVCTTWGVVRTNEFYLIDVKRVRLTAPDLLEVGKNLYAKYEPDVILVEAQGENGGAFCQLLARSVGRRVYPRRPKGDKVSRAEAQTVPLQEGRVHVPSEAGWLEDFRREILAFPSSGHHDDQVDSMVQFLGNSELAIIHAVAMGRRHHTDRQFDLPRRGPEYTFYTIGPRRLVKYFSEG